MNAIEKPKILIVDDNQAHTTALEQILEDAGMNAVKALDGPGAMEATKKDDFILILMDVGIQGDERYETARSLHQTEKTKQTPIIFITAEAIPDAEKTEGYTLGAVDYLLKPVNPKILLTKIRVFTDLFIQKQKHMQQQAELEEALQKADSANKEKSKFLATMSHEIRTPLNGIMGTTALLAKTSMTESQNRYTEIITSCSENLMALINDTLDISKIEAGELEISSEKVVLEDIIRDCTQPMSRTASGNNTELAVMMAPDLPQTVMLDALRVRQILTNLVSNAIKFTSDGYVLVTIVPTKKQDETTGLQFIVEDSGIGIPQDKMDQIFSSFTQADSTTTREYGGTGLGLAISKQLTEMMGGQIDAQSMEGAGSTFWFEIPAPVCEGQKPLEEEILSALKSKRVLIIDDSSVVRKIYGEYLQGWNIDHSLCGSGTEALEEMQKALADGKPYDIAVTDYHMPEMDGATFIDSVRKNGNFPDLQFILATAAGRVEDLDSLLAKGFSACLLKPVYPEDFFTTLSKVASEAAKTKTETENEANNFNARILLVEDDRVNQMLGERVLHSFGCQVEIAENGIEAVEMVQKSNYDLVFMDCMMPRMDGYEATRAIRNGPPDSASQVIVAMTANAFSEDKKRCLDAGMNDYIAKPAKEEQIHAILMKYLRAAA